MTLWIPDKHKSVPKLNGAAPQSELRKAVNRVLGVRHVNGQAVKDLHVLTERFEFGLSQALLEEARSSRPGKFLLELLAAVSYAGDQRRPVMLVGHKVKAGGFRLTVVVPVDTSAKPGPVPMNGQSSDGVEREG